MKRRTVCTQREGRDRCESREWPPKDEKTVALPSAQGSRRSKALRPGPRWSAGAAAGRGAAGRLGGRLRRSRRGLGAAGQAAGPGAVECRDVGVRGSSSPDSPPSFNQPHLH
ncbi:Hypothetical predicted protein [Marmota monax]|uniref:Uncharacterized protein n=1 Tax=Marmota monax TaxID=9995 RepID=A0A5E4AVP2_MARMO|nr:Hypothetical predicted protein [Marmota monax]